DLSIKERLWWGSLECSQVAKIFGGIAGELGGAGGIHVQARFTEMPVGVNDVAGAFAEGEPARISTGKHFDGWPLGAAKALLYPEGNDLFCCCRLLAVKHDRYFLLDDVGHGPNKDIGYGTGPGILASWCVHGVVILAARRTRHVCLAIDGGN